MDRAKQLLDRMQQNNADGPPNMQNTLNNVERSMARLNNSGTLIDDKSALDYFNKNVYDPLSQLESELTKQLDAIEMDKKLYGARKTNVPPEYRKLVNKYYESIAKSKK